MEGEFAVPTLAALGLAGHDDARGNVREAAGRFYLVDILPTFPTGAEGVELDIRLVDFHGHIFDFRHGIHTGK